MALRMCDCAQGLWPCAYCTKSLRLLVLRELSPVLPTGAPDLATVAWAQGLWPCAHAPSTGAALQHLCEVRTGPLALCSIVRTGAALQHLCSLLHQKGASHLFGAKEHTCGRLTSPTCVRRRTGVLLCSTPVLLGAKAPTGLLRRRTGPLALCSIGAFPFGGMRRSEFRCSRREHHKFLP